MNERHKARPRYFVGVEDRGACQTSTSGTWLFPLTISSKLSWLDAMTSGIPKRTGSRSSKLAVVGLDPLEEAEADVATSVLPEKGAGVPGLSLPEP